MNEQEEVQEKGFRWRGLGLMYTQPCIQFKDGFSSHTWHNLWRATVEAEAAKQRKIYDSLHTRSTRRRRRE